MFLHIESSVLELYYVVADKQMKYLLQTCKSTLFIIFFNKNKNCFYNTRRLHHCKTHLFNMTYMTGRKKK